MTTEAHRGAIEGGDARARAVRLAGVLAERGVGEIIFMCGDERRVLRARVTDLPGLLADAAGRGECLLEAPSHRATFRIERESIEWRTDDAALATALGAA